MHIDNNKDFFSLSFILFDSQEKSHYLLFSFFRTEREREEKYTRVWWWAAHLIQFTKASIILSETCLFHTRSNYFVVKGILHSSIYSSPLLLSSKLISLFYIRHRLCALACAGRNKRSKQYVFVEISVESRDSSCLRLFFLSAARSFSFQRCSFMLFCYFFRQCFINTQRKIHHFLYITPSPCISVCVDLRSW